MNGATHRHARGLLLGSLLSMALLPSVGYPRGGEPARARPPGSAVDTYFPKRPRVVSLFSGNELPVERRLGLDTVAVDALPAKGTLPGNIKYVSTTLPAIPQGKKRKLPRELSSIRSRYVIAINPDLPRDGTFSPAAHYFGDYFLDRLEAAGLEGERGGAAVRGQTDPRPAFQDVLKNLFQREAAAGGLHQTHPATHPGSSQLSETVATCFHRRSLSRILSTQNIAARPKVLFDILLRAQQFLPPGGGKLYLVTEYLDSVPLVAAVELVGNTNYMLRSKTYEQVVLSTLQEVFPGIRVRKNPAHLKELLWPKGVKLHNGTWGRDVASAWEIEFPGRMKRDHPVFNPPSIWNTSR